MKRIFYFLCLLLLFNCENDAINIELINGYWEIKEVKLNSGDIKQYPYNETIEFISVDMNNNKGFRKKLKPGLNNTYYKTSNAEELVVEPKQNSYFLVYTTPYNTWKEEIVFLNNEKLSLKNSAGDIYSYTKYTSIVLDTP